MKFSTKSTYGLKAIVNLARHPKNERVPLSNIAKEEKLSLGYLERIFAQLKDAKLVKAEKGASGGYWLAKNPKDINTWEIMKTLEGGKLFYCFHDQNKVYCSNSCRCDANQALAKVQATIDSALKKITLSELIG